MEFRGKYASPIPPTSYSFASARTNELTKEVKVSLFHRDISLFEYSTENSTATQVKLRATRFSLIIILTRELLNANLTHYVAILYLY